MMRDNVFNSGLLDESVQIINHRSGLTVALCPKPGAVRSFAGMVTKYGSVDTAFSVNGGEKIDIADGTAHFLEHKLFDGEQGDAFELFAATGADANAFTSFDRTCYYFSTTRNFYEALKILLQFVTAPYFTEQTVAKEQGIIGQEIKMYDDSPGWRVYFNLLRGLYCKSSVTIDIAGTVQTIATITPRLLGSVYGAFYNLHNMVLAVAGDFEREKVLELCDECLPTSPEIDLTREVAVEPEQVAQKEISQNLEVSVPLFMLGYKQPVPDVHSEARECAAGAAIIELAAGEGSRLYREMYDSGLINSRFSGEYECGRGYCHAAFSGESKDPEQAARRIREAVSRLREGFDEEDFKRVKTKLCGMILHRYNSCEQAGLAAAEAVFSGVDAFEYAEAYFKLTSDDVRDLLRRGFCDERSVLSVVRGFDK